MALTYLGSLTVGAINPALGASLAIVLPKLQAELAAAVAAKASIEVTPMTIALSLDLAGRLVADIQAAIALGVQWPSISVQLQLYLDLIASIQLSLGLLTFDLGAAGIHAYAYDGTASGLGPADRKSVV